MNKNNIQKSRRDFLKKGITGVAGASLLPSFLQGKEVKEKNKEGKSKPKLIYRTLGRTGIRVPIVGFGCGGANNENLLRAAVDAGVMHFDVANICHFGNSETTLGEIMKGKPRDSFVVSTKVLMDNDPRTGLFPKNTDIGKFKKKFTESIDRLQTGYVDILYLHMMNNPAALGFKPLTDVMLELKKQGKIRAIGVSTHENEPEVILSAVDNKIFDVILTSYNFRQPHKEEVKAAIDIAAKAGLGVVVMKTQAGVYWDSKREHPINMKAALKWALQDKNVHASIPGITNFEQLELDVSVMEDLKLTPAEIKDLKLGEETNVSGLFCPQCGDCRSQCRYNLDIPTLMRSYMYAYGYRNPAHSKWILEGKDLSTITCRDCKTCAVSCTMGFNVPEKIKDIVRVLDVPEDFLA
jgi:predicted aldo/keto reductase-like oxidoreductase